MIAPGAKILVVDDDRHDRRLLEALLLPEGYLTITAADGETALASVAEQLPDLILLDVMLPGMDGHEVARQLKADPATSGIPIIMLTAQIDRESRIAGLEAGAEEFLTKPVDRAELWLRVRNLLRLKHLQESLVAARDEANRANRAKSDFLSRMSHELRTPLNAVLGFGQILSLDTLSKDQRESVELIRSAGRHLLDLINDVLDIARIETGGLRLSLEPVHVDEVLRTTLDLVRLPALDHRVTIKPIGADADVFVLADRQRLVQVLLNVMSNAVKYNRPGGEISIACSLSAATVSIAVSDTGIGMTDESMAKLFVPFERLGAERTEIEGAGIGMALSQVLSQHMGGTLTVFSTFGVGSTFTIELPEGVPVASAALSDRVDRPAPSTGMRPITVLCFEDNVVNIRLIESAMRLVPNAHLVNAIQGSIGLDLAEQLVPDVILLDLHLPDMAGEDVLRRLRAGPTTGSIPVLVTTADASPGQDRRLLELGAAAYLTKPLDLINLFHHLERIRTGMPVAGSWHPT